VILGARASARARYEEEIVAAVCQVTQAGPGFGNTISHSHRRNKRRFDINIQKKKYFVPSLKRTVTLTVSTKGMKTIEARGIESVVASILARGVKL
jgi:large subunit ribosomal protein L28